MRSGCLVLALLACCGTAGADDDRARYSDIRKLIRANRHMSAHMVMAVDARTIKAVRGRVSAKDIPVLVRMMGDKNYGVASAASGLLVTLGKAAKPALESAASGKNSAAAEHARSALGVLQDCYDAALRASMSPDVCPGDNR
jgi:hypothetical protein